MFAINGFISFNRREVYFKNVPSLIDVITMHDLLMSLGVKILRRKYDIVLQADDIKSVIADYDLVRKMRASILVLGPLLARFGKAEVSLPGGCAIGSRPVDLHLNALKKMGAEIEIHDGYIKGNVPNGRLIGTDINLSKAQCWRYRKYNYGRVNSFRKNHC